VCQLLVAYMCLSAGYAIQATCSKLEAAAQQLAALEARYQGTCSEVAAVQEELATSVESNKANLREVEVTRKERDAALQRLAELEAAHQTTCDRMAAAERQLAASREAHRVSEAVLKNELAELMLAVERAGI
jgi:septal ring factor EnvC (AmiA/AmiB activator)